MNFKFVGSWYGLQPLNGDSFRRAIFKINIRKYLPLPAFSFVIKHKLHHAGRSDTPVDRRIYFYPMLIVNRLNNQSQGFVVFFGNAAVRYPRLSCSYINTQRYGSFIGQFKFKHHAVSMFRIRVINKRISCQSIKILRKVFSSFCV